MQQDSPSEEVKTLHYYTNKDTNVQLSPEFILCFGSGRVLPNNPKLYPLNVTDIANDVTCQNCLEWLHA